MRCAHCRRSIGTLPFARSGPITGTIIHRYAAGDGHRFQRLGGAERSRLAGQRSDQRQTAGEADGFPRRLPVHPSAAGQLPDDRGDAGLSDFGTHRNGLAGAAAGRRRRRAARGRRIHERDGGRRGAAAGCGERDARARRREPIATEHAADVTQHSGSGQPGPRSSGRAGRHGQQLRLERRA